MITKHCEHCTRDYSHSLYYPFCSFGCEADNKDLFKSKSCNEILCLSCEINPASYANYFPYCGKICYDKGPIVRLKVPERKLPFPERSKDIPLNAWLKEGRKHNETS